MESMMPRKQRKEMFNAPLHKRRKWLSSHLEEKLLLKYDKRSISVIKGDTVKVMRGSFRGHEDKVAHVNVRKRYLEIEGITMSKADGNKIAKPIHPSNVMITKLNLTDKWRRKKLERGLTEETKKEIEKEAEIQIKEEEKKKKVEEEKLLKEKEETSETEETTTIEKTEEKPKTEEKKEETKAAKPPVEVVKQETKPVKEGPKPQAPKTEDVKKEPKEKPVKKPTIKTKKIKEEKNK